MGLSSWAPQANTIALEPGDPELLTKHPVLEYHWKQIYTYRVDFQSSTSHPFMPVAELPSHHFHPYEGIKIVPLFAFFIVLTYLLYCL